MPTTTFENLSEEKRECILQAAIAEFAERRFSDASINRIVKAAGISRGRTWRLPPALSQTQWIRMTRWN